MRTKQTETTSKALNDLGRAYDAAKPIQRMAYRVFLSEKGEKDDLDYWRAFRDNWRFSGSYRKAPFVIVFGAMQFLSFDPTKTLTNE